MSVLLGYLHPNTVSASFQRSLSELVMRDQATSRHLSQWAAIRTDGHAIPEGRNTLARQALESDDEWLFMIDADMGFAPDTLDRLLAAADPDTHPIVGGLAFAYREIGQDGMNGFLRIPQPTIFHYIEHDDGHSRFTGRNHYPVNKLIRVAATGGACVLIHRSVLEAIRDRDGENWFTRIPGPDGLMGEDISFCARAGSLNIPIHVHTGIRTTHHKELWVGEPQFWDTMMPPPATEPVTVIIPTVKARIDNLTPLLRSLKATTGLAEPLIVVDDDEHHTAVSYLFDDLFGDPDEWGMSIIEPGSFGHKINAAWDSGLIRTKWIKVVGDDCVFHPRWLDHLQHVADLYDAKVVGSNDLANRRVVEGIHATHWMIDTDYIREQGASWDGPGIVAHEGYRHWFVDDEIVLVAQQRGVYQPALGSIVEHMHPIAGKAEMDETYRKNDTHSKNDRRLFLKRKNQHDR